MLKDLEKFTAKKSQRNVPIRTDAIRNHLMLTEDRDGNELML